MAAVQTTFDFARESRASVARGRTARHPGVEPASALPVPDPATPASPTPTRSPEQSRRACEDALSRRLAHPVVLTVTDNGRTMLSSRDAGDHLRVRAHHMFLDAGPDILDAVAGYLSRAEGEAQEVLRRFVKTQGARIRKPERRAASVDSRGRHHDLAHIFADVNRQYFDGDVVARIGWSRRSTGGPKGRRRSIKLGSYRARDALIRVHPVLDASWVPRYFVEYIVYHEMLHHVVPMPKRGGRRLLHGPEFNAREQRFEHYQRAIAWERQHLDRLLGG